MSGNDADAREEQFATWMAACDDALAAGEPPPDGLMGAPIRAQGTLACAKLLREVFATAALGPEPSAWPADPGALPWKTLGRFELRRELGRGGCGVVYLAYDPQLAREVALKVPHAEVAFMPHLRERFQREARAASSLDHPNCVPVYEGGEVGPVSYIVSAYCPGTTLAQWLQARREPVPFRTAAALIASLAEAVAHAHSRGVIHRDLKPANILPTTAKITDFGL